jgi:multiple sugar transport system substrate-binding protein
VKALEELIAASKHQSPNATTNGLFDNWKEFSRGNTFCNIGWGSTQKYLNSGLSRIQGSLEFGPTPGGMVNGRLLKTSYFNWDWNYTVANSSAHKEIAYLFTLFACSPTMSTVTVRENDGYFDPFREEHYADPGIQSSYSFAFLDEHRKSMKNSIPDLYLRGQAQYYDALRTHITLAHDGKLTVRQALDNTAKIWNRLHIKFGPETQAEQWHFLKGLYPASLRNFLT